MVDRYIKRRLRILGLKKLGWTWQRIADNTAQVADASITITRAQARNLGFIAWTDIYKKTLEMTGKETRVDPPSKDPKVRAYLVEACLRD